MRYLVLVIAFLAACRFGAFAYTGPRVRPYDWHWDTEVCTFIPDYHGPHMYCPEGEWVYRDGHMGPHGWVNGYWVYVNWTAY